MSIRLDQVGASVRSEPFEVTAAQTVAYAEATNDDDPAHLSGEIAPPLFAVVPALKTMVAAKRLATEDFTLHGEHDLTIERPIEPGMTLVVEARLVGLRNVPGGAVIVTEGVTRTSTGDAVNRQHLVSFAKGARLDREVGEAAPAHRMPAGLAAEPPAATFGATLDADQTQRYGEASGDRSAYTFDEAAARAQALPGPIVHGLLTMAVVGNGIVDAACPRRSARLKRFAVRFSGLLMLRPAARIRARLWRAGSSGDRALYACEADGGDGGSVIRHGWAEIAEDARG